MGILSTRSSKVSRGPTLFFFFFVFLLPCASSSSIEVSYKSYCHAIVPQSSRVGEAVSSFLGIPYSFLYRGAESILGRNDRQSLLSPLSSARFTERGVYATDRRGILRIDANLYIEGARRRSNSSVFLVDSSFQPRIPKRLRTKGSIWLSLGGFWEESSGKLCMVGSGWGISAEGTNSDLSAVLKLNFTKNSTISRSLVTGALEFLSKDGASDVSNIEPVSLLGVSRLNHSYSLDSQAKGTCSASYAGHNALSYNRNICDLLEWMVLRSFDLEYDQNCKSGNCSIFGSHEARLTSMSLASLGCSNEGKVFLMFGFSNTTYESGFYRGLPGDFPLERTLIGEGIWDEKSSMLCLSLCRLLNHSHSLADASIGDCTMGMTLSFRSILTIKNRKIIEGSIWSNKRSNDSGYFGRLSLAREWEFSRVDVINLKYEYTQVERVKQVCKADGKKHSGSRYPDGYSINDMVFQVNVKNSLKQQTWGSVSPLANDKGFYRNLFTNESQVDPMYAAPPVESHNGQNPLNISYVVDLYVPSTFRWRGVSPNRSTSVVISAEGVYDPQTGALCMVGCRYVSQDNGTKMMDCEISMKLQLPPLSTQNFDTDHFSGKIESMRKTADPLYFDPLKLSSSVPYISQISMSSFMMDMEIAMVLISLTLVSIFVLLQLLYVKKHPEVLPFVSLAMTAVLTLGHMIPLVLNFEASFANRQRNEVLYSTNGWVEVDEVLVRMMTMIAFLLQFRFLQLVWSARSSSSVSERKSLNLCVFLYILGGLFACFAHWRSPVYPHVVEVGQPSVLDALKSYAGLVLDGFLFPQVLLNVFSNLKERALAPSFFIGLTVVRSFPHMYDVYRCFYNIPRPGSSYYYADPEWDFYSSAWDFMIPFVGLVFAILIYLQQRFGGRCILPPRLRERIEYQKVPVVVS